MQLAYSLRSWAKFTVFFSPIWPKIFHIRSKDCAEWINSDLEKAILNREVLIAWYDGSARLSSGCWQRIQVTCLAMTFIFSTCEDDLARDRGDGRAAARAGI